jgi:curved DNA-binding protein CbpA
MAGMSTEQLSAFVRQIFPRLDQVSYYDLLGVPAGSDQMVVRAAFYRLAADLHPDRYHALADRALKEQLEMIYARVCEGYRVLTTPDKRAAYERALTQGKKRLTATDRESRGPQNPEDSLKHPDAKKFFRMGMICLARKDWKGAIMNLNFARTFEPGAALITQKLSEAQAALGKPGGAGGTPPKTP